MSEIKPLGAWITCKECGSRSWAQVSRLPEEIDALRARLAAAEKVVEAARAKRFSIYSDSDHFALHLAVEAYDTHIKDDS